MCQSFLLILDCIVSKPSDHQNPSPFDTKPPLQHCSRDLPRSGLSDGTTIPSAEPPKKAEPESSTSWFGKKAVPVPPAKLTSVIDGLKEVYFNKVQGRTTPHN
jgi:hypothetical protein